jgi:hypothetical protein
MSALPTVLGPVVTPDSENGRNIVQELVGPLRAENGKRLNATRTTQTGNRLPLNTDAMHPEVRRSLAQFKTIAATVGTRFVLFDFIYFSRRNQTGPWWNCAG